LKRQTWFIKSGRHIIERRAISRIMISTKKILLLLLPLGIVLLTATVYHSNHSGVSNLIITWCISTDLILKNRIKLDYITRKTCKSKNQWNIEIYFKWNNKLQIYPTITKCLQLSSKLSAGSSRKWQSAINCVHILVFY